MPNWPEIIAIIVVTTSKDPNIETIPNIIPMMKVVLEMIMVTFFKIFLIFKNLLEDLLSKSWVWGTDVKFLYVLIPKIA